MAKKEKGLKDKQRSTNKLRYSGRIRSSLHLVNRFVLCIGFVNEQCDGGRHSWSGRNTMSHYRLFPSSKLLSFYVFVLFVYLLIKQYFVLLPNCNVLHVL
jgi:hypothetical protein